MQKTDVIIIGAGAAGLMCAIEAGKRHRRVLVIDHANKAGKKILMSGGGRCNFTNYAIAPEKFLSHNPHFCKSALNRYTQWDFIALVKQYHIPFHEKTLGQLFCDNKAQEILSMLLAECERFGVNILLNTEIERVDKQPTGYELSSQQQRWHCDSLVIASGGLSIPTMGASPFGYKIAEQFGISIWPTRAGLVPLTLHTEDKEKLAVLSGISIDSLVTHQTQQFRENILFTHRGMSGPAILQISSYWQPGDALEINLLPEHEVFALIKFAQKHSPQKQLKTILLEYLPKRLLDIFIDPTIAEKKLAEIPHREFAEVANVINHWILKPNGTEGYRTAEVTLGGVDCNAISSKTMECLQHQGLYFIGEVLDVTGWLGGYNFQWAWSSGWAAGQVV